MATDMHSAASAPKYQETDSAAPMGAPAAYVQSATENSPRSTHVTTMPARTIIRSS